MGKRKFNSHRLYLLIRAIVILTSLLLLFAHYNLENKVIPYLNNQFDKDANLCNSTYSKNINNLTKPKWLSDSDWINVRNNALSSAQKTRENCINGMPAFDLQSVASNNNLANIDLSLAILLPLVFFGGRLAYKFVFPKQS